MQIVLAIGISACALAIPVWFGWKLIRDVDAMQRANGRCRPEPSQLSDARSLPSASSRSSCSCIHTVWYESMRGDVSHS